MITLANFTDNVYNTFSKNYLLISAPTNICQLPVLHFAIVVSMTSRNVSFLFFFCFFVCCWYCITEDHIKL